MNENQCECQNMIIHCPAHILSRLVQRAGNFYSNHPNPNWQLNLHGIPCWMYLPISNWTRLLSCPIISIAFFGFWVKVHTVCILERGKTRISVETGGNIKFETLSNIIGAFKTTAATRINKLRGLLGTPAWQRSFYDRIIRNEFELERIREYILYNPVKWAEDRDTPSARILVHLRNQLTTIGMRYSLNNS